jgi:hypothetical protein
VPDEENVAAARIFREVSRNWESSRLMGCVTAFMNHSFRSPGGKVLQRPLPRALLRDDMSHLNELRDYFRISLARHAPGTTMAPEDEILHYIGKWDQEMREVREAMHRPKCRWPLNYADGIFMDNSARQLSQTLAFYGRLRVLALAAKGDAAGCAETLVTHFRLARVLLEGSPGFWGTQSAAGADLLLLQTIQDILDVVPFDESQRNMLQREISLILLHDVAQALRIERVSGTHSCRFMPFDKVREGYELDRTHFPSMPDPVNEAITSANVLATHHRPEGWKLAEAADYANFFRDELEPCVDPVAGTLLRSRFRRAEYALRQRGYRTHLRVIRHDDGLLHLNFAYLARHQAMANEALLWCAIERFRLKHGRAPDRLDELVPAYLDKLPCDPVIGKPLHYVRRENDGYLIYSVGWNEKDDGGVVRGSWENGDWVWSSNPKLIVNADEQEQLAKEKARAEGRLPKKRPGKSIKSPGGAAP